jgi:hypothetical protein
MLELCHNRFHAERRCCPVLQWIYGFGHCEDRAEYLKATKEHDNGTDGCKVVLLPVILTTGAFSVGLGRPLGSGWTCGKPAYLISIISAYIVPDSTSKKPLVPLT